MISGSVNPMRHPSITVVLIDEAGRDRWTEANLDTGFTGELTLPRAVIDQLGLVPSGRSNRYRVGTGATETFNSYEGAIRWRNGLRMIEILEAEVTPLVGIGLLWGNNLSIDFQPGGSVAITELPDC